MSETILRECACGTTFIPAGDELECTTCEQSRGGRLVTPTFRAERLFFAPETLCGQLPFEAQR
jgi:hypothetical protein